MENLEIIIRLCTSPDLADDPFKWIIFPCHVMNGRKHKAFGGGAQEMGSGKVKILDGLDVNYTCLFRREGGAA